MRRLIFLFLLVPPLAKGASTPLPAQYIRETGIFALPTNAQFSALTIGAVTVTNFTSFSNNHAVVNGVFFTNLFAAKTYAVAGDTIRVLPGIYRTNNLLKAGVNWFFYPGADIYYTNSGSGVAWGIFDDRATGSVTCNVAGSGRFHYSGGMWGWSNNIPTRTGLVVAAGGVVTINATNYLTERGVLVTTNSGTRIRFEADDIGMSRFGGINDLSATIYVSHCGRVDISVNRIHDPNFGVSYQYGEDEFDVASTSSTAQGIYWERGDLHIHRGDLMRFGSYGIWASDGPSDATVYDFWFSADLLQSGVYFNQLSQTSRSWWKVKNIECEANTGGGSVFGFYGRGRHYVECGKLGTKDTRIPLLASSGTNNMEVWLTAQKVSSKSEFIELQAGTTVYATVQEYEDVGGVSLGIYNTGGTITLEGGGMTVTNGIGVWHQAGVTRLNGVRINTSPTAGTNSPIFVAGPATTEAAPSGVSVRNCWLTSPALGYPVNATNAQFVRTIGSAANTNSSANVTFTVGTMTVHGTVQ